jgi:hypothetical protein
MTQKQRFGIALIWLLVSLPVVVATAYYISWEATVIVYALWWIENVLKGTVLS